jgi:ABC-type phosphate transport system auxiliary subunit
MATIDTLALAERLEREYGDDPERARRHARILGDMAAASDVATKQDIKDLRVEIGQLRTEMQHEFGALRGEMQHEIAAVRGEVQHEIAAVRGEIGQLRTEMHEMEGRLRIEVQSEGNKLRAELHKEIAAVRGEVGNLAWKVAGLLVAQAAVIIALIRLLPGGTP